MLDVSGLEAGYGRATVLRELSLTVGAGEVLVLMGRNGAGKSTALKALIGLLRPRAGRIGFDGVDIAGWPPYRIARAGIGYVPEERRIFADLTVSENLDVGRKKPPPGRAAWTQERLFALFPNLAAMRTRLGRQMSGGEQQMLTIARTLMGNPRLILLDEPSEGIAPVLVEQIAHAVTRLKDEGIAILLAEQNLRFATAIGDRAAILQHGRVAWTGSMAALAADEEARQALLAV